MQTTPPQASLSHKATLGGQGRPLTQLRLFLIRGVVAIAWAVVFAMASGSLTTGVGVLLVLYPLIDVVGSVIDARGQQGSARQLLETNAAVSAVADAATATAVATLAATLPASAAFSEASRGPALSECTRRRRCLAGRSSALASERRARKMSVSTAACVSPSLAATSR